MVEEHKIKLTISKECLTFEVGDKKLGPYSLYDLDSPNFREYIASELGVQLRQILEAELRELQGAITLDEVLDIISTTVKRDNPTKAIIFLSFLLTYTEEDQTNIALQAESSSGKSYI
ncbi:MAG: hypothetical protein QXH91_08470, partial [Candidatus Bathyarchaeia archaeon]